MTADTGGDDANGPSSVEKLLGQFVAPLRELLGPALTAEPLAGSLRMARDQVVSGWREVERQVASSLAPAVDEFASACRDALAEARRLQADVETAP